MIEEIESLFKKFQLFPITNAKIHSRFHSQFKAKLESIMCYMNQITNPNALTSKKFVKKISFRPTQPVQTFLWNLFQSSILYLMPCAFTIGNSCKLLKIFCEEIKNPSSEIIWPFCKNGFSLSGNSKKTFFDSNQKHSCSIMFYFKLRKPLRVSQF